MGARGEGKGKVGDGSGDESGERGESKDGDKSKDSAAGDAENVDGDGGKDGGDGQASAKVSVEVSTTALVTGGEQQSPLNSTPPPLRVIKLERGPDRRPPNVHDLRLFTAPIGTVRVSEEAADVMARYVCVCVCVCVCMCVWVWVLGNRRMDRRMDAMR